MTIQISELKVELRTNSLVELYNMKCMGSCSSLLWCFKTMLHINDIDRVYVSAQQNQCIVYIMPISISLHKLVLKQHGR